MQVARLKDCAVTQIDDPQSIRIHDISHQGNIVAMNDAVDSDCRHHRQIAMHTLQQGDRGGASATPDITERE